MRVTRAIERGAALLLAALVAARAEGGQYLIASNDDWQRVLEEVRPGDEIVLMPGRHRPGALRGIRGTGREPIVLRGLTLDRPSVIDAESHGLLLVGAQHVVVQDLVIENATAAGIIVEPEPELPEGATPPEVHVRIRNVTIRNDGHAGPRMGIAVQGVARVQIEGCVLEGWGPVGIAIEGAASTLVRRCTLLGGDGDHDAGVQVRGGSEHVRIVESRFEQAGVCAVLLGAAPAPRRVFDPGVEHLPPPAPPVHEAVRVQVQRCVIVGSACPIHFLGARDCQVRNVTIVRPRQWAFAVDVTAPGVIIEPSTRVVFGSNLIVWEPGDIRRMAGVGPRYQPRAISIEENLWWAPLTPEEWAALGELPEMPSFPQIIGVDPELDEDYTPGNHDAGVVGAFSP